MRALVVYESMFGNTKLVAEAIAEGLATRADVELAEVSAAPTGLVEDVDLLVLGGPTHAFSMSRASTRADAATKSDHPLVSEHLGIREWIDDLVHDGRAPFVATFDTKVSRPRLPGSAANAAEKQLRKRGFARAARATTFYVDGMTGPLLDGELDRARAWGVDLVTAVRGRVARAG